MISKDVTETPVESTIKSYPRLKDGRAEFLAPISNHAGLVPCATTVTSTFCYIPNLGCYRTPTTMVAME